MSNIVPMEAVQVHAPYEGSDPNEFPGPFAAIPTPMQLELSFEAGWGGGDVVVVGRDKMNAVISETFAGTPGGTVQGLKVFAAVDAATKSGVAPNPGKVTITTSYPTLGPEELDDDDPNKKQPTIYGTVGSYESSVTALSLKARATSGSSELTLLYWEDGKWWPHPGAPLAVDDTMLAKRAVTRFVTAPRKTYYHLWKTGVGSVAESFLRGFTLNWPA